MLGQQLLKFNGMSYCLNGQNFKDSFENNKKVTWLKFRSSYIKDQFWKWNHAHSPDSTCLALNKKSSCSLGQNLDQLISKYIGILNFAGYIKCLYGTRTQ
jgi:hypothetical protein